MALDAGRTRIGGEIFPHRAAFASRQQGGGRWLNRGGSRVADGSNAQRYGRPLSSEIVSGASSPHPSLALSQDGRMELRSLGPGDDAEVLAASHLLDGMAEPLATTRFLADPDHHLLVAYQDSRPAREGFPKPTRSSLPGPSRPAPRRLEACWHGAPQPGGPGRAGRLAYPRYRGAGASEVMGGASPIRCIRLSRGKGVWASGRTARRRRSRGLSSPAVRLR